MKDAALTAAQQDEFRQELDRMFGSLDPVPPRDRLMPTRDQLGDNSLRRPMSEPGRPWHRIPFRLGWRWGVGAALALSIGTTVVLQHAPATPPPPGLGPGVQQPFIAPWTTQMTSRLQNGRVSFTFVMTNRQNNPLTVKPWTQPFQLILTPTDGGESITRVEHFPQSLTIPVHQSRRWTVTVPVPPPGRYDVVTSTVGVHWPGGSTWDRMALGAGWFSPYSPGTVRAGTLTFHQTVRRDGYTVRLTSLVMTDTKAQITFQVGDVPYFPTNYTVYVRENGQVINAGSGSQRTPSNQPVTRHATLIGTVTVNPIPKTVGTLTVSIANLGVNGSGSRTVKGPWTFRIRVPRTQ